MTDPQVEPQAPDGDGPSKGKSQTKTESGLLGVDQLGEFRVLRRLGRGGMADVYLAEQTSLHRHVALKVLRNESVNDQILLERFRREAKAAGGLVHPNIVQVYTIGEEKGLHYIAQEYVQGMNLREYLQRRGAPDVGVALHILKQVAVALQAASEAGIVHRDIKPENILITRKGKVKVADFGLAQLSMGSGAEGLNLTQVGMTMGTPLYMSPEQVNGKKLDQRSDIYSFGVSCFHILAARPPFEGETAMAVAIQHVNNDPPQLRQFRADLPDALCHIVHKMMSKDPAQRYDDAKSVLADFRRVESSIRENPDAAAADVTIADFDPVTESQQFATAPVSKRVQHEFGRHPLLALMGSCLVVGLVTAVIVTASRPADPLDLPPKVSPAKPTIQEQFEYALREVDNVDAWIDVVEHQKPDPQIVQSAREQLGLLYLRDLRYADAQAIFDQFATTGDRATHDLGLAGMAIVASLQKKHQMSQSLIDSRTLLDPNRIRPDSEYGRLLREADASNRRALGRGP